jgi:hypothetical protein
LRFPNLSKTVAEIRADTAPRPDVDPFKQAILAVAREKDWPTEISSNRLGEWCKKTQKRVIDGLRVVPDGKTLGAVCWKVEAV